MSALKVKESSKIIKPIFKPRPVKSTTPVQSHSKLTVNYNLENNDTCDATLSFRDFEKGISEMDDNNDFKLEISKIFDNKLRNSAPIIMHNRIERCSNPFSKNL